MELHLVDAPAEAVVRVQLGWEAIGEIGDGEEPHMNQFEGYTDEGASESKVLRNVFADGDRWFRTGDLMRRDAAGFFYFVDRAGDTFRWKGENVSTTEVAQAVAACRGVREAVVYGVAIPGLEGRAGMAAVITDPDFSLEAFRQHIATALPSYARPIFVRIARTLQITGTFKPAKGQLVTEGYDPTRTDDPIYFYDRAAEAFVKLGADQYAAILNGEARL